MPVTKKELPNVQGRRVGTGYVEPIRPVLYCRECGATYSASPGDYWNVEGGKALTCDECGEPLELACKLVRYVPWAHREAASVAVRQAAPWPVEPKGGDD